MSHAKRGQRPSSRFENQNIFSLSSRAARTFSTEIRYLSANFPILFFLAYARAASSEKLPFAPEMPTLGTPPSLPYMEVPEDVPTSFRTSTSAFDIRSSTSLQYGLKRNTSRKRATSLRTL